MNRTAKKIWTPAGRRARQDVASAKKGLAALEFALTLPIWITLLLGIADGSYYFLVNERIDRIAYSITDIITQYDKTPSRTELNDIMLAAGQIMQPIAFNSASMGMEIGHTGQYIPATGYVTVTSVFQPATGNPIVEWQYTYPPADHGVTTPVSRIGSGTPGSTATLPNGLTLNTQDNIIVTEVYFTFSPLFLDKFLSQIIYRLAVYKPRLSPLTTPPT